MIFSCHFIQSLVVNAYPLTCGKAGGHILFFFILNSGHPWFLWNNLSWTHPGTIRNRVNDASLMELENLSATTSCICGFSHLYVCLTSLASSSVYI